MPGIAVTGLHWLLVKPAGLSISSKDQKTRERTIDVMLALIDTCAELGGKYLVHGSPQQRRVEAGETRAAAMARAQESFAAVAERAQKAGVVYCIEALSAESTPLINTLEEAAQMVRQINSSSVRTMLDCSAAGRMEKEPLGALIERWVPKGVIAHVQVNDRNRRGPGQGEQRFAPAFRGLETKQVFRRCGGGALRLRARRPKRRGARDRLPARHPRGFGGAPLVEVAPGGQRAHLAVGHVALQHPEAAVGMDVAHPSLAQDLVCALDGACDLVRALDLGALDVDDAEAEADLAPQVLEHRELFRRAMRGLHHDMVDLERVEVLHQLRPGALLDRLPAVIAEAQMHRSLGFLGHGLEHLVDRRRGPFPFVGMAGEVGFVHLHHVGVEALHLVGENVGNRVRELSGSR
jgi:hypothetical protein